MTSLEIIKQLFLSFSSNDYEAFVNTAKDFIELEKRKKHNVAAKELEKALLIHHQEKTYRKGVLKQFTDSRDSEKGFPLLEIRNYESSFESLILSKDIKDQLEQIIRNLKMLEVLATYNLTYKKKVLLCGRPGTGKTFSAQIISSVLNIPLVYVRFDSIISSYLGETATNLRKVFDYIENGTWIVLFDEFDIIGKNRDDNHEHGEIKRVVNNFLQMLDNFRGDSIIIAATNHQNMLDSAIWRRFDDVIYFELPNEEARLILFNNYLRSIKRDNNLDLVRAAKKTEGLSPSDIKMITEEAMKLSIINSINKLTHECLELAINKFIRRENIKYNKIPD